MNGRVREAIARLMGQNVKVQTAAGSLAGFLQGSPGAEAVNVLLLERRDDPWSLGTVVAVESIIEVCALDRSNGSV